MKKTKQACQECGTHASPLKLEGGKWLCRECREGKDK